MTELRRELGVFSCTMLVAGNMIGIGIFVTAGRIVTLIPNPSYVLLAWLIGGALSLAGALSYAELGTRFPRAGGGYVYLREAFGPFFGFLSGFSSSWVTLPGTAAFLAIGFTRYAGIHGPILAKCLACGLILLISVINYLGVKWGADLQDGFMVLKLFLIFFLIFAGFYSGRGSLGHFVQSGPLVRDLWVALPLAMVPVMYAYSGWDATVYVAGEVRDPERTIPVSLFTGTFLVSVIYLSLASLYIYAIPVTSQDNQAKIATAASKVLFGESTGRIIGGLVAISILGCLSATILTGPRILYAMAKDRLLPRNAGAVHPSFASPSRAILYQCLWSCLLAVTGTFDQLLDYVTVPSVFFAGLAVVGLFKLRAGDRKDPESVPYLTFGYPVVPALFVLGTGWIVLNTAIKDPRNSLWGLFIVILGSPIYFFYRKWSGLVFHKPCPIAPDTELLEIPADLARNRDYLRARKSALEAFKTLSRDAGASNISILALSAFRDFNTQSSLYEKAEEKHGKGKGILWLAPPGYSEHHTGYVFDLADGENPRTDDEQSFEETPAFLWLRENASKYGFELSFPSDNWQNVSYEPWHWRFIGDESSLKLFHPGPVKKISILLKSILKALCG